MSLSVMQRKFLSARAICLSDDEARQMIGGPNDFTFSRWRQDQEFMSALTAATADIREAAQLYAQGLLHKASETIEAMLGASKLNKDGDLVEDWDARAKAVDFVYASAGLRKQAIDVTGNVGIQLINDSVPRPDAE